MGATGPDPSELKSWQQAFDYPISTTRQIEKKLRNEIASDKERLRTLVGASYRDLLGTAEGIVHLDEQMRKTEHVLRDVSLQCNLEVINTRARHLAEMQQQNAQSKRNERQLAAQLTLLQRCQRCVPRMFRRRTSILTTAKVLAISRLLNKSISQAENPPPLLNVIRQQLSSQRRRLLSRIDVVLLTPDSSLHQLAEAICAFCIATSSSWSDAIRHFHDLWFHEITESSSSSEQKGENVLTGFRRYLQVLRITKQLFGRPLSEAFRDLRSQPILQSPDILSLEDLNVTSIQQFVPAEIIAFVPWIKHQNAHDTGKSTMLEQWSSLVFKNVCDDLVRTMEGISDVSELLSFRAQLLQIWLPVSASAPTHSPAEVFDALRKACNARMKALLRFEAEGLSTIGAKVESVLQNDNGSSLISSQPIWDHNFVTAPLGKGASWFKKQLLDRQLGHSKSIKSVLSSLQAWTSSLSRILDEIQHLRKVRWIDTIEEDEEDDESAETIEKALQKGDPDLYEQEHRSLLTSAILEFQHRIEAIVTGLGTTTSETRRSIVLLRTIRGLYQHLRHVFPSQTLSILSSTIPHLHQILASTSVTRLLDDPSIISSFTFTTRNAERTMAIAHLWEGNPISLPTHPSPHIFKFLQRVTTMMADQGLDLWSKDAVDTVKEVLKRGLVERKLLQVKEHSKGLTNGREKEEGEEGSVVNGSRGGHATRKEEAQRVLAIQSLFDVLYLSRALNTENTAAAGFDILIQRLRRAELGVGHHQLDPAALATLESRVKEYWARTALLFGLLA